MASRVLKRITQFFRGSNSATTVRSAAANGSAAGRKQPSAEELQRRIAQLRAELAKEQTAMHIQREAASHSAAQSSHAAAAILSALKAPPLPMTAKSTPAAAAAAAHALRDPQNELTEEQAAAMLAEAEAETAELQRHLTAFEARLEAIDDQRDKYAHEVAAASLQTVLAAPMLGVHDTTDPLAANNDNTASVQPPADSTEDADADTTTAEEQERKDYDAATSTAAFTGLDVDKIISDASRADESTETDTASVTSADAAAARGAPDTAASTKDER